nr:MAG TPA_asm: hypothetical protein [Caudoviricetes sp.]
MRLRGTNSLIINKLYSLLLILLTGYCGYICCQLHSTTNYGKSK